MEEGQQTDESLVGGHVEVGRPAPEESALSGEVDDGPGEPPPEPVAHACGGVDEDEALLAGPGEEGTKARKDVAARPASAGPGRLRRRLGPPWPSPSMIGCVAGEVGDDLEMDEQASGR